ncbi:LPS export ABC transporter periplasmic protein LptC [Pseudogemmobacter sonorensis]|uniref:LPS export ABC transporter periplasmic protein LptC n=1 Tax=Pseudogemmobacter sonorensis TaxID=2989681 RepID=UPI0036B06D4A
MPAIDRHSRIVGWLKVVLPLAALALLSTLFLLADRIDPSAAIPYAEVDVEALARDPRMTAPTYAGTTEDGTAITLTAEAARPATAEETAEAEGVTALLSMPDGGESRIAAGAARLDNAARELELSEGVVVETSTGYRIETAALTVTLDRSGLTAPGDVIAIGPAGRIEATGMVLQQQEGAGTGGEYLLVFSGRVKLLYQPES